jgi:hypothetical protein
MRGSEEAQFGAGAKYTALQQNKHKTLLPSEIP